MMLRACVDHLRVWGFNQQMTCLNNYCPVALTPVMSCFEKLVLSHLRSALLPNLDELQRKRSTIDASMLLLRFTSALNTLILHKQVNNMRIGSSVCIWIMGFLKDCPRWEMNKGLASSLNRDPIKVGAESNAVNPQYTRETPELPTALCTYMKKSWRMWQKQRYLESDKPSRRCYRTTLPSHGLWCSCFFFFALLFILLPACFVFSDDIRTILFYPPHKTTMLPSS